MATVSITIADDDTEEDGVLFRVEFDPPLEDDQIITAAQSEASLVLEIMQRRAMGETLKQIAEEVDDEEYGLISGTYEPVYNKKKDDEGKPN